MLSATRSSIRRSSLQTRRTTHTHIYTLHDGELILRAETSLLVLRFDPTRVFKAKLRSDIPFCLLVLLLDFVAQPKDATALLTSGRRKSALEA